MIHPYDLPLEEFMLLPEDSADDAALHWGNKQGPYPLRKRDDPTGVVDAEGRVWVPVQRRDGSWARRHIFSL